MCLNMMVLRAGAWSARLMGWQERLAYLRDLGRWGQSLHLGLSMFESAAKGETASLACLHGGQSLYARSAGQKFREMSADHVT